MYFSKLISICFLLALVADPIATAKSIQSEQHEFEVQQVATGLSHPWSLAFLPNGDLLVTERPGRLRIIQKGVLRRQPIAGLPDIRQHGQGGLLDIALHPNFKENRWIYLSYAGESSKGINTEVLRARLVKDELKNIKIIFKALPKSSGGRHFGGRLVFDKNEHLFISLGDRGDRPRAQQLDDHTGSLIRIKDDGTVPDNNPFLAKPSARTEIYSYGHRNIQGMAIHPHTKKIWLHEHGPQGGDEINIVKAGVNYGWPVITYGVDYVIGTKIGVGTHKEGMEQPLYYWTPSIAPSGMTFYTGDEFLFWKNNLFVGSLKFGLLIRLVINNGQIVHEEQMLDKQYGRIRDVRQGSDGALYLLTDEKQGAVLRLRNVDTVKDP